MVVLLSLCWFSHNKVSRVVLFLPNTEIAIPCSLQYECLDFPGGPVVKTLHFQCGGVGRRGVGSIPDWGAKIPHASQRDQKKKRVPAVPSSNRNEYRRKVTEPMSFLATTENPCPSESMSKQASCRQFGNVFTRLLGEAMDTTSFSVELHTPAKKLEYMEKRNNSPGMFWLWLVLVD